MTKVKNKEGLIWNLAFGVEDSLVSTVGLLSGIATAGVGRSVLFLTGVVLIFVEAFSMSVGSFIADQARRESSSRKVSPSASLPGAVVMLVSYLVAGLVPLLPYLIFDEHSTLLSISFSLGALIVLGLVLGLINRVNPWREAFRTGSLGGIAILIGVVVGRFVGIN